MPLRGDKFEFTDKNERRPRFRRCPQPPLKRGDEGSCTPGEPDASARRCELRERPGHEVCKFIARTQQESDQTKMKRVLSLLMLGAALCVTSASANYFSDPLSGSSPAPVREITPAPASPATHSPSYQRPAVLATVDPIVRQYIVFFDFDKSDLTPEAQQIVSEAVKVAKEIGPVRIVVTVHTDKVGSDRYNQRLSERRALAIKSEMVRLGMSAANIITLQSSSEPLIPTGKGIRETQSRRAVIDLDYALIAELPNWEDCTECESIVTRAYRELRGKGWSDRDAFLSAAQLLGLRHPGQDRNVYFLKVAQWLGTDRELPSG